MVTLEFALIAPVFLLFLFSLFGVAIVSFYQMTLDDAVRDVARQVQMGTAAASSGPSFVAAVCAEFGLVASNCSNSLTYNIQSSALTAGFSSISPEALPASGLFSNQFAGSALSGNANVLIQVAYPLPFRLPFIGSLVTLTGTNSIVTAASVRMEPFL